jgi:hypothetical protein
MKACSSRLRLVIVAAVLALPALAGGTTEINKIAGCQKKLASAGANFARQVITANLKCTQKIGICQVQCEQGLYGPCDPDDRNSNTTFAECMADADDECAKQNANIARYETLKQQHIIAGCDDLTQDELCGASTLGLNFVALNAGCQALDPNYTCNLTNLINCVGGPLERQLADQVSALLDPRAPDAIEASSPATQALFPNIPVTRKRKEDVVAGRVDLWKINGKAGDEIVVRVNTRDDTGSGGSTLSPLLVLLAADHTTPIADTNYKTQPCNVPNSCSNACPAFRRTLPFDGDYYVAVAGHGGCTAGLYRLAVEAPKSVSVGATPDFDDATP